LQLGVFFKPKNLDVFLLIFEFLAKKILNHIIITGQTCIILDERSITSITGVFLLSSLYLFGLGVGKGYQIQP